MVDMSLMEMVSLWLAANGITPKSVSLHEVPVVTGSLLVRPTAMVQDWLDGKRQMEAR